MNNQSSSKSDHFIIVEFPKFDFTVLYSEFKYVSLDPPEGSQGFDIEDDPIAMVYDPDTTLENVEETKYRKLLRSHRNILDRELKPNPKVRDELNVRVSLCRTFPRLPNCLYLCILTFSRKFSIIRQFKSFLQMIRT